MVLKSGYSVLDRFHLQRPGFLNGAFGIHLFDLDVEVLTEVDLRDLGMSDLDSPFRIRAPTACRHDPAQAEDRMLGAAEKLVDPSLTERVLILIALALDGDPLS